MVPQPTTFPASTGQRSIFPETEVDPNGTTNYSITGVTQMLSVLMPFTLLRRETVQRNYNDLQ